MREKSKEKGNRLWFRLVLFLVPRIVGAYFGFVRLTSRIVILNPEHEQRICKRRPFVGSCFHGTMLWPVYHCRQYPGVIMVSRSWDGEIIDRCIRRWGFDTTRGSSSKGGKDALTAMIERIRENNYCSGLAVDAPRGPAGKVKMGIITLGRETGQPIVPLVSWATRKLQFRSWDRMILPLPFSTIVLAFGRPIEIPTGLAPEGYEALRLELENEMKRITYQAVDEVNALMEKGRSGEFEKADAGALFD